MTIVCSKVSTDKNIACEGKMDKWIHKVVADNIRRGKIADNEAEIYEYGYTLMVEKTIMFAISVVIALITDAVWEVFTLCITFIPLRVYSGGYHAKSRWGCMVLSGLYMVLGSIGIKVLSQLIGIPIYLLIEFVCFFVTIRYAPVATKQKLITASEDNYYRERVIMIAGAELMIGLVCIHFEMLVLATGIILSNFCNTLSVLGQVFCNNFKGSTSEENKIHVDCSQ